MKKEFKSAEISVIKIKHSDIITSSDWEPLNPGGDGDGSDA